MEGLDKHYIIKGCRALVSYYIPRLENRLVSEPFQEASWTWLLITHLWRDSSNSPKVYRQIARTGPRRLRLNAIVETPRAVNQMPTTGQAARKKCSERELLKEAYWKIRRPK